MGGRRKDGKRESRPKFHRDMVILSVLEADARAKELLLGFGLPCHRCVVAESETLAEGCAPLGLEVDGLVAKLNALNGAEGDG